VCTIDAERLIDLQDFASEQSIMLEIGGKKAGILTYQSRFLPDWKTSNTFHIIEETNRLKAPEAYLHYRSLLKMNL